MQQSRESKRAEKTEGHRERKCQKSLHLGADLMISLFSKLKETPKEENIYMNDMKEKTET